MCGRMGTYEDVVPMCIHRRVERIDRCISEIVAALEAGGCEPRASCCGHGEQPGTVMLRDQRTIIILPAELQEGAESFAQSAANRVYAATKRAMERELAVMKKKQKAGGRER